MHILLIVVMAASILAGNVRFDADLTAPEWHAVTVNGNEGVIISREDGRELLGSDHEKIWFPSEEWLTEAELAMRDVSKDDHNGEMVRPALDGYRQYLGFIENSHRKIAINSFCTQITNWRNEYVIVMDGGECFWGAVYNVDTGEVEGVRINGPG